MYNTNPPFVMFNLRKQQKIYTLFLVKQVTGKIPRFVRNVAELNQSKHV